VVKLDPEMLLELSRRKAARERGELGPAPVFDPDLVRTETSEASEADRVALPIAPKRTTTTASPWAAEAVEIERSALPSALAPSVRSVPVPASVTPVSAAPNGETRRRMLVPAVVLVIGAIGAFAVMKIVPKTPGGAGRPESSAAAVGSGALVAPASAAPSAAAVAVPAASAEVDAGARVVPAGADGGLSALVKAKGGAKNNDDPYDAATPTAVKTAEPVVAPPPTVQPPPTPTMAPSAPKPPASTNPFDKPNYD
jgi:hypothetical protein